MLTTILIGSLTLIVNLIIQIFAVVAIIRYIVRQINSNSLKPTFFADMWIMSTIMLILFFGHMIQFAIWATLFMFLDEFSDFQVAFYHSVVNFTSLGYGDIVMSERWRLLGGLEAANGILMFGLTASTFISVTQRLFSRHKVLIDAKKKISVSGDSD